MLWRSYENTPVSAISVWSWRNIPPLCLHFCYMRFFSLTRNHLEIIPSSSILYVISEDHRALLGLPHLPGTLMPGILAYFPLPGMPFSHFSLHVSKSWSFLQALFKFLYPGRSHSWTPFSPSGNHFALPWCLMAFGLLCCYECSSPSAWCYIVICISIPGLIYLSSPWKHGYYLSLYFK